MDEQEVIVALATALVHVRKLDADSRVPFTAVYHALEDVEKIIFHYKERFGVDSVLFQQGCEEFLLLSNTLPMQTLQRSPSEDTVTIELCGELLLRAEQHTSRTGYLRSLPEDQHVTRRRIFRLITLNNLACHAKHSGRPLAAVVFLEKALKLQLKSQSAESNQSAAPASEVALTRLNLCAVLSQLNRHAAAAVHAKAAVAQLAQNGEMTNPNGEAAQLLLVAHYNLAVELEHLHDYDAAWRHYMSVLDTADHHGLQHDLVQTVQSILAQGSLRNHSVGKTLSPRTRTPRGVHIPQRPPLSPRTLRQAGS